MNACALMVLEIMIYKAETASYYTSKATVVGRLQATSWASNVLHIYGMVCEV